MIVYFSFFLAIALSAVILHRRNTRNVLFIFFIFTLFIFVGFREWTGCDYASYLIRYNRFLSYGADFSQNTELGFSLLNNVLSSLALDYMWLNVSCAGILAYALYRFGKGRDGVAMLAMFFPIFIVQLAMSGIRQATAVAFLILAFVAFLQGRRLAVAVWIIVAGTFHASAFLFLPIAALVNRKMSLLTLALASALLLPVAALLVGDRADLYQQRYIESEVESGGAIFRYGLLLGTAVLFYLYRTLLQTNFPREFQFMRLYSVLAVSLGALLPVSTLVVHRLGYYLIPAQILVVTRLQSSLSSRYNSHWLYAVPLVIYGAYHVSWLLLSRHADYCYLPYGNFLFWRKES